MNKIVTDSLQIAIDRLEQDIDMGEILFVEGYFDKTLEACGGGIPGVKILHKELKKILEAHKSDELYMPSDFHFKLLDRVMLDYCECYVDIVGDKGMPALKCDGREILKLDHGYILDYFYWDTDYDIPCLYAPDHAPDTPDLTLELCGEDDRGTAENYSDIWFD